MNRQHPRHRVHAQAAIGLAALPLLLSTASITAVESTPPTAPASGPGVTAAVEDAALSGAGGVVATSTSAVVPELKLGKVDPTDIPWAAVQSYHRAADILGHVQPSCGVSWTLLAAMGRVGSDHGRAGPSDLRDDGVAAPAVVGLPLDGKGGRAEVADTDGGALDGDTRWDRAIGPMQIRPDAWGLAGVDGDGDGTRSPDDIDDAALAAAVYLCASGDDLQETANAADALLVFSGSERYVAQVLAVATAYADGSFEVGSPPSISSIGDLLVYGDGVKAESARVVEALARTRPGADPVRTRTSAEADPVRTRSVPAATAPDGTPDPPADPAPADQAPTPPAPPVGSDDDPPPPDPADPAEEPAVEPAEEPVEDPTDPAEEPAEEPTDEPTEDPTDEPVEEPTVEPCTVPETDDPADASTPVPGSESSAEVVLTGTWWRSGETFCLDDLPVDPTSVEAHLEQLLALVDTLVELTAVAGTNPLVVIAVNDLAMGADE